MDHDHNCSWLAVSAVLLVVVLLVWAFLYNDVENMLGEYTQAALWGTTVILGLVALWSLPGCWAHWNHDRTREDIIFGGVRRAWDPETDDEDDY